MADAAAIHREAIELAEARDFTRLRELLHPDYTYWGNDGTSGDVDAAIAVVDMYTSAFPGLRLEIKRTFSCRDDSVLEFLAQGTHSAPLGDIPPTGKTVAVPVCNVIRVQDGMIIEERDYFDQLGMLQQLGVAPA